MHLGGLTVIGGLCYLSIRFVYDHEKSQRSGSGGGSH